MMMTLRFAWLCMVVFGAAASSAFATDFCDHPETAICSDPPTGPGITSDQIRAEVSRAVEADPIAPSTDPADVVKNYVRYIGKVYGVLLNHFAKQGISASDIDKKIATIRAALAKSLSSGRMGQAGPGAGAASDAELARKVSAVTLLDPSSFLSAEGPVDISGYYEACGEDGLINQAYYSTGRNRFVICPGYFLEILNIGSLEMLDFTVGHELTHSVDADKDSNYSRYVPFLDCMQRNYGAELSTAAHVAEQLGAPAQKRLAVLLARLKAMPGDHAAEIVEVQYRIKDADERVDSLDLKIGSLKESGRASNQSETHASELTADAGGAEAMIELLKTMPKERRANALKRAMQDYCPASEGAAYFAMFGPLKGDDGLHASLSFRLKNIFNNPQARLLLGCKNLNPPQPWCAVGAAAPIAARCDRKTGIDTASECEGLLEQDLKASGCVYQDLDCEPSDGREVGCSLESLNCQLALQKPGSKSLACADRTRVQKLHAMDPPLPSFCVSPLSEAPSDAPASAQPRAAGALR